MWIWGFPGGSVVKNPPANAGGAGNMGLTPGLGRSPGEGNDNLLQYSCLESPMDRAAWRATVYGVQRVRHNQIDLVYIDIIHIDGLNLAYWTDTNPAD